MNLPECPDHKEGKGCERSELRLLGENRESYVFLCACCKLVWMVTKTRTKEGARYANHIKKVKQATEAERAEAARPKVFGRHYAGVRTV